MKYVLLLYGDESAEHDLTPEERRAIVDDHMRFRADLRKRGALVQGEPLDGRTGAFTVRLEKGGKRLVTDGPFAETKEQLGSFYVVECAGRDEAVAIAQDVPASPGLVVEVWPVAEI
jgi:hypothetical protein